METYIKAFGEYIRENKISFDQTSPQPCLDALWWHYCEYCCVSSEIAREGFQTVHGQLASIPALDSETIFTTFCSICAEYERIAFTAGLRLGAQLMMELRNT